MLDERVPVISTPSVNFVANDYALEKKKDKDKRERVGKRETDEKPER